MIDTRLESDEKLLMDRNGVTEEIEGIAMATSISNKPVIVASNRILYTPLLLDPHLETLITKEPRSLLVANVCFQAKKHRICRTYHLKYGIIDARKRAGSHEKPCIWRS